MTVILGKLMFIDAMFIIWLCVLMLLAPVRYHENIQWVIFTLGTVFSGLGAALVLIS